MKGDDDFKKKYRVKLNYFKGDDNNQNESLAAA